jgi:hypothetical protein
MNFRRFEKLEDGQYWPIAFELLHPDDEIRVFDPGGALVGEYRVYSEPYPLQDGNGSLVVIPIKDQGALARIKKARE